MLYEVRIVEPEGHVPRRFEFTRETPFQQGDMFMLRDLFFLVRRVHTAQQEYDGVVEVRRMVAPGEEDARRLGETG